MGGQICWRIKKEWKRKLLTFKTQNQWSYQYLKHTSHGNYIVIDHKQIKCFDIFRLILQYISSGWVSLRFTARTEVLLNWRKLSESLSLLRGRGQGRPVMRDRTVLEARGKTCFLVAPVSFVYEPFKGVKLRLLNVKPTNAINVKPTNAILFFFIVKGGMPSMKENLTVCR